MNPQPANVKELKVGRFYKCQVGQVTRAGQLFMLLHTSATEDIDMEIRTWTRFYLNEPNMSRKFNLDCSLRRMVVVVIRASSTVYRGLLVSLDIESRKAVLDCVDLGEIRQVSIDHLYEATPEVVATKWKTVPCVLDGLAMFLGTHFMEKGLQHCSFIQTSKQLRMTVKGKLDSHFVIVLECFSNPKSVKNVNTMINEFLQGPLLEGLKNNENSSVMVSEVRGDGMIYYSQVAGLQDDTAITLMESFLSRVSYRAMRRQLPAVTPETVDLNEVYLAPYEDGVLYRAKILEKDEKRVEVEYIDYGNREVLPYTAVFQASLVDVTMASFPPLAKKAYLRWIQEFNDLEKAQDILTSKTWKVEVRKSFRNGCPMVCLFDPVDSSVVNKKLILDGFAKKSVSSN